MLIVTFGKYENISYWTANGTQYVCDILLVFVAIRGPKTLLTLAKLKPLLSTTFNASDDFRHVWK